MSQHLATPTLDARPIEIVVGFDRRLEDDSLVCVGKTDGRGSRASSAAAPTSD